MSDDIACGCGSLELTDETIAEAVRMAEASTPKLKWGQWKFEPGDLDEVLACGNGDEVWLVHVERDGASWMAALTGNGPTSKANARFFAHARPIVLAMAEEITQLRTKIPGAEPRDREAERDVADDGREGEGVADRAARPADGHPDEGRARAVDASSASSSNRHVAALVPGQPIWYRAASVPGAREYAGVVDQPPRKLGDCYVVRLREMEPAYSRDHHPRQARTTVAAAYVDNVRLRATRRTPPAAHTFAGVDPKSPEGHLRSVLWEILGGMGAESVEDAARRVVRERDEAVRARATKPAAQSTVDDWSRAVKWLDDAAEAGVIGHYVEPAARKLVAELIAQVRSEATPPAWPWSDRALRMLACSAHRDGCPDDCPVGGHRG